MSLGSRVVSGLLRQSVRLTPINLSCLSANLHATHGEPYPYSEPFPYKTKKYRIWHDILDWSKARMNENSRVIVVDGNFGVGKTDFARKLAKEFDLMFVPPLDHVAPHMLEGIDHRKFNEVFPHFPIPPFYGLEEWFKDPNPKRGRIGNWLFYYYRLNYFHACQAYAHLFHTGQGIVLTRSAFNQINVFKAMRDCGYISPKWFDFMSVIYYDTICELARPHIFIYLDAPVSECQKRIDARKDPLEMINRSIFSDEYLTAVEHYHKTGYKAKYRKCSHFIEVDWSSVGNDTDIGIIAEELQKLTLDATDSDDPKFNDWYIIDENKQGVLRRTLQDPENYLDFLFSSPPPAGCTEVHNTYDEEVEIEEVLNKLPALEYQRGYNPKMGDKPFFKF